MGRKKYYCDYCQRAFNDDPKARAAHLNSSNHLMLRDEHYKRFKDAATLLTEEQSKKPCFHFHQDGSCRFDSNCKYSHMSPEEIEHLKRKVNEMNKVPLPVIPNVSEWWRRRVDQEERPKILSYNVPFETRELPPSLIPFDIADYLECDIPEWGD